jgi:hypothetical protein
MARLHKFVGFGLNCPKLTGCFVVACALTMKGPAHSATISIYHVATDSTPIVELEGNIDAGDFNRFWAKTCMLSKARIVLRSPGGSAIDGIQIGEMVKIKQFDTIVPNDASCNSACALAWLGGARRFAGTHARIGFHAACEAPIPVAASDRKDPCRSQRPGGGAEPSVALVSSVGNAMIGAYVRKIGLKDSMSSYITKAPHESVTLLNQADALEQGIEVTSVDFPSTNPNPPLPEQGKARTDFLEHRATDFINKLFETWSKPNQQALAEVARLYADQVSYYGSVRTADAVSLDKRASAERWPDRDYKLRPNSLTAKCDAGALTCRLDGIVTWKVENGERHESAVGETSFLYELLYTDESFSILLESSADYPRREIARYPQAACGPMPIFHFPGATESSRNPDPWVARPEPIEPSKQDRQATAREPELQR